MKIYQKLFFANNNKTQFYVAGTATLVGFLLLLVGINYVIQIQNFRSQNELLTDNVFVVQRKISSGGTLKLQKTEFNERDQKNIQNQPFIENFQPLVTNDFDVDIQLSDVNMPYMRTDIFLQSILPEFLDVKNIDWTWNTDKEFVPIIVPKEFFIMMNSFMSSKGMPQISEELAKDIRFKLNLKSDQRKESVECRIVGFTSVFSAVLVPDEFMEYGSNQFGNNKEKVTQLIVSHTKDGFGDFKKFLEQNYLETKATDLIMSQVKSMTFILFNFIVGLALLIIVLSAVIFSQYSQLMIESKKYEIQTMLRLGHQAKVLSKTIYRYFFKTIVVINGVAFISWMGITFILNGYFAKYGFDFANFISIYPLIFLGFINFTLLYFISRKIRMIIIRYN